MTDSPLQESGSRIYATSAPVIEIEHLKKSFGSHVVLRDVNLVLHEKENVVVLGRSGTGKSVLIKCIVGLMRPNGGSIRVFGEDVLNLNLRQLDQFRQEIGFSFQGAALYDSMTVRENLEFPLVRNSPDLSRQGIDAAVEEALDNVGLLDAIDQVPSELSGGMKKRVGIARTLILKPRIMLYDEPTAGLDPITAREINELILSVQERYETASIIITHDITCARMTANHMIALVEGYSDLQGTFDELQQLGDPRLAPFFEY